MNQGAGRRKSGLAPADTPAEPPAVAWYDRPGWKSLKAVVELFGILGGVVSVAFVGYSLWDAQHSQRIEQSLSLVRRFNEPVLSEATETLRRATLEMNEQLELVPSNGQTVGFDPEVVRIAAQLLTSSDTDRTRGNQAALVAFARFFDETAICVNSRLCDKETVCLYLADAGREVYHSLGAGLDAFNERSGVLPVGDGLGEIADKTCKAAN